jgi:hypothetical protein
VVGGVGPYLHQIVAAQRQLLLAGPEDLQSDAGERGMESRRRVTSVADDLGVPGLEGVEHPRVARRDVCRILDELLDLGVGHRRRPLLLEERGDEPGRGAIAQAGIVGIRVREPELLVDRQRPSDVDQMLADQLRKAAQVVGVTVSDDEQIDLERGMAAQQVLELNRDRPRFPLRVDVRFVAAVDQHRDARQVHQHAVAVLLGSHVQQVHFDGRRVGGCRRSRVVSPAAGPASCPRSVRVAQEGKQVSCRHGASVRRNKPSRCAGETPR